MDQSSQEEQLPENHQAEAPPPQGGNEARKRLEQELNTEPEVTNKDLKELEDLHEQMIEKRQKVAKMNQLCKQKS